jgi:HlyD family secretion protein
MRGTPWAATAAILFLIAFMFSAACAAKVETAAASQATVQRGSLGINITASGNLKTAREENLAFYSSGTVQEVLVKVGDTVKEGQALARLDMEPLQSNLEQMQINVKQARLNLENAEEPKTDSSGSQVISTPDPLNIEIKQLQLKNAQSNLQEAQKKLDKATITATFSGLITEVNVVPGDQVTANTVAIRLIDPENFITDVLVNETEIFRLKIGTPATVKVVAVPANSYPARISLIAETATISSNVVNYKVTVEMSTANVTSASQAQTATRIPVSDNASRGAYMSDNASRRFPVADNMSPRFPVSDNMSPRFSASDNASQRARPSSRSTGQASGQAASATAQNVRLKEGLTVTVNIAVDQRSNVLLVPNRAITSRAGSYYVNALSAKGTPEERAIQVGITDGENTEVLSGLSEGDKVNVAANTAPTTSTTTRTTTTQQRTPSIPGIGFPR